MGYLPNAALFATIGDILVSLRIIPSLKGAGKCYEKEKYKASDPAAHHFIHLGQLVRGTEPRRGKSGRLYLHGGACDPRRAGAGGARAHPAARAARGKIHAAAEKGSAGGRPRVRHFSDARHEPAAVRHCRYHGGQGGLHHGALHRARAARRHVPREKGKQTAVPLRSDRGGRSLLPLLHGQRGRDELRPRRLPRFPVCLCLHGAYPLRGPLCAEGGRHRALLRAVRGDDGPLHRLRLHL